MNGYNIFINPLSYVKVYDPNIIQLIKVLNNYKFWEPNWILGEPRIPIFTLELIDHAEKITKQPIYDLLAELIKDLKQF